MKKVVVGKKPVVNQSLTLKPIMHFVRWYAKQFCAAINGGNCKAHFSVGLAVAYRPCGDVWHSATSTVGATMGGIQDWNWLFQITEIIPQTKG